MALKAFIDIGSTYTKAVVVDPAALTIVATAKAPTTYDTDVVRGLRTALRLAEDRAGPLGQVEMRASCSAAGGLRMVSVGLVAEYSAEAARRAALGAGAKIVGHFSNRLNEHEIRAIEHCRPDIVLLAGGTDGGNEQIIVHNAQLLAASSLTAPIVVAGNKCAYDRIAQTLEAAGKEYRLVANVMPDFGRLEVDECREAIRAVFVERIVRAKGIDRATALVQGEIIPTPLAVLRAARLLSEGAPGEVGQGDLVVIDVGGATTDVYSIARGEPASRGVSVRGLPEPFAKRTVEGDLGVRHNIDTLAALCRSQGVAVDQTLASLLQSQTSIVPRDDAEARLDAELARVAVQTSFDRHVGRLEMMLGLHGEILVQVGKDLTRVATVIGTGGPIVHASNPGEILSGVLAGGTAGELLKPARADLMLDRSYVMFAMGLLAQSDPLIALRILKRALVRLH